MRRARLGRTCPEHEAIDALLRAWAGEGCLARPGFRGASYVAGEFRVHTDGQVSFRWAGNGNQDAVKFQRVEI